MKSLLTKSQKLKFSASLRGSDIERGCTKIVCTVRYDDSCNNGHNSFGIITWVGGNSGWGGADHDAVRKYFPELAKYIKWHHMRSDGPMHYLANTLYHAGDRDCNGLLKGEVKQLINGRSGLPSWKLVTVDADGFEAELDQYSDSAECPIEFAYRKYVPWCRIGEGKEPELKLARSSAIWPEAELEDFTKENLEARLPNLIAEFKRDIEELGMVF